MEPRKFVVDPKTKDCHETEDFRYIEGHCRIARWFCHRRLIFVNALYTFDWIFFGTQMAQVTMSGEKMHGLVITQYDVAEGSIKTSLRTANVPIGINSDTQSSISSLMAYAFTPIGHALGILPEGDYFHFQESDRPERQFPDFLANLSIEYQGEDPKQN